MASLLFATISVKTTPRVESNDSSTIVPQIRNRHGLSREGNRNHLFLRAPAQQQTDDIELTEVPFTLFLLHSANRCLKVSASARISLRGDTRVFPSTALGDHL